MATFVGGVLAVLLPVIWKLVANAIRNWRIERAERLEREKKTEDARQESEKAQTPQEREDAAKDTIRNW